MHGTTGQNPPRSTNVIHQRISSLTLEYIDASPERQSQIDQEVEALIDGKVSVFKTPER